MRFQVVNGWLRSADSDPKAILLEADALFKDEQSKDLRGDVAAKTEELRHYDVKAMDRVAAICCWGRSGSLLLASYFDNHGDVITLPEVCGQNIYGFFELYGSMPLHEKLLSYPAFQQLYSPFFEGNFAISRTQYYAAVQAIRESFGDWPQEFLTSRRSFFLFLHIAYNLALGRRPATSHPLIVFAQHRWNNVEAMGLLEDFPRAKFIHTVRDPISVFDRGFDHWFGPDGALPFKEPSRDAKETRPQPWNKYSTVAPWNAFECLVNKDRPHLGMESITRTIRFEDMHSNTEGIMRDLADWLGLPYDSVLLDSTFNGVPYVVASGKKVWSGKRLEQAHRHDPRTVSAKDRALLFALFYENFVEWNYPCPKIYKSRLVRCSVFLPLFLIPTKMELRVARVVLRRRILPSIRHGNISIIANSFLRMCFCRAAIVSLLVADFSRRRIRRKHLLHVDLAGHAGSSP